MKTSLPFRDVNIVEGSPLDPNVQFLNKFSLDLSMKALTCSIHKTDISIKPCQDCLKLLDTLLKKYNILSDIEV